MANYPFDGNPQHRNGIYAATPEDALMRHLASTYAQNHGKMAVRNRHFPGGITNGAKWYVLYGGSQDYHYLYGDCIELTFELSYAKHPPANTLDAYWQDNRPALYAYINEADRGIKGQIKDHLTGAGVLGAEVTINGKMTHAGLDGIYFRLLLPGVHSVKVSVSGRIPVTKTVTVVDGPAMRVDFEI